MLVKRVVLKNFGVHDYLDLTIPDGASCVVGPNGSGKSTILEAIAWAREGEDLRGQTPAREGCSVRVETDKLWMLRELSGGNKTKLRWAYNGKDEGKYESLTHTKRALAEALPPYKTWLRTCVYTVDVGIDFFRATDAARKTLLEDMLDLSASFDAALKAARADVKRVSTLQQTCEQEIARATDEVTRVTSFQAQYAAAIDQLTAAIDQLTARATALIEPLTTAYEEDTAAQSAYIAAHHHVSNLMQQRQHLTSHPTVCHACNRPFDSIAHDDAEQRRQRQAQLDHEIQAANEALREADRVRTSTRSQVQRLLSEKQHCMTLLGSNVAQRDAQMAAAAGWDKILAAAREKVAEQTKLRNAHSEQLEMLADAVDALSPTGVRAVILESVVASLMARTNAWLGMIFPGVTVDFRSTNDKDQGVITVAVKGRPGGTYKSCSQGERRRLDIAVLFAFADIAGARDQRSTLWLDEMFDGLDGDSRETAVSMLRAIAVQQPIVVISHVEQLMSRLPTLLRLSKVFDEQGVRPAV